MSSFCGTINQKKRDQSKSKFNYQNRVLVSKNDVKSIYKKRMIFFHTYIKLKQNVN